MDDVPFRQELEQFLRRRRHFLEPPAERHHGEAHVFQILHHPGGMPAVVGDFPDVVRFPQAFDELLDKAVMDDVSFRRPDEALLLPDIVEDMVTPTAKFRCVFRQPEELHQDIFFLFRPWREGRYRSRNIRCAGQVRILSRRCLNTFLKEVATSLIRKIKTEIAEFDHWTDKQETKAAIGNLIRDTLWAELPACDDEISISMYRRQIYEYVYTRYKDGYSLK